MATWDLPIALLVLEKNVEPILKDVVLYLDVLLLKVVNVIPRAILIGVRPNCGRATTMQKARRRSLP